MSSAEVPPPPPKLPIWDVVGAAYTDYLQNFADVLRASWLWLAITAVFCGVMSWQQWSMPGAAAHKPGQLDFATMSVNMACVYLVLFLATISIAVAWHRRIILGERPPFGGFNIANGSFWRCMGIGLLICGFALLPILLFLVPGILILTYAGPTAVILVPLIWTILFPLIAIVYVLALAVMLRLSMLLPARATGDLDLRLAQSWHRTRGNCWRIFWGGAICVLAPMMVAQIALTTFGFPDPKTLVATGPRAFPAYEFVMRMTAISTVVTANYLLTLPIGIGFLSLAYRHFFREPIAPTF
jgi:hypothetical protein